MVAKGDGYWCEHDNKSYESMERRYVLRVQAADFTGESFLALFNDQVHVHCHVAGHNGRATCKRVAMRVAMLVTPARSDVIVNSITSSTRLVQVLTAA